MAFISDVDELRCSECDQVVTIGDLEDMLDNIRRLIDWLNHASV
jgi:hypothetical protein